MPETPSPYPAQMLCASASLNERGDAAVFDVLEYGRKASAFALRYQGVVRAYLNRCAHVPTEMDWQPGKFWDADGEYIICSVHGALYVPSSGLCVGGPCVGRRLQAIQVEERNGQVYWYPSSSVQPWPPATPPSS